MGPQKKAHLVVLNGVFYEEDGKLMVSDEELGTLSVDDELSPCEGLLVHFVAHHCPPEPPQPDRWGGGSCLLEPTGRCHCGHHERPKWLYEIKTAGLLFRYSEQWFVKGQTPHDLHLGFLVGHYGQILCTAFPDPDGLEAEIEEDVNSGSVEALQNRITRLRDMLSQFNKQKDDIDV
jgi:hypothetical protein